MKDLTVSHYVKQYLSSRVHEVAPSTLRSERCKASKIIKLIGQRYIDSVTHSDIIQLRQKLHKSYANKSINEFYIILRAIFNNASRDGVIVRNPMDGVQNLSVCHAEPNPFSRAELTALAQTEVLCLSGKNAFQLCALTGLRISELLAISWEDIDFINAKLKVKIALVDKQYKTPKTPGSQRTVELCASAISILTQQKLITGHRKARKISVLQRDNKTKKIENLSLVFYNTQTNQPFISAKQFNKTFFTPFLASAKVKHRGAGQLRHTFASQALTSGISKEWLARQMGHESTAMIDIHYARWMCADAPDFVNKVEQQFQGIFTPIQAFEQATVNTCASELPAPSNTPTGADIQLSEQQLSQLLISHPHLITQHLKMLLSQNVGEMLI
ncbi:site-specific integrase [Shewanella inventionis]|uniref:Site-specific integrase n=1 Tax=Shewanella inventionis TaxID=1738770 RepID=A0ABQ1J3W9_9GAMM|nr:site-specific integrase [Shewanella inventionis]MCL1157351.1 site-specific integrase [Shewanella inventionis]UAL42419.1 site-specific integrase [Shewanella inventionis]GGB58209.1 site-specific integrase [Shewanella inventionis]